MSPETLMGPAAQTIRAVLVMQVAQAAQVT